MANGSYTYSSFSSFSSSLTLYLFIFCPPKRRDRDIPVTSEPNDQPTTDRVIIIIATMTFLFNVKIKRTKTETNRRRPSRAKQNSWNSKILPTFIRLENYGIVVHLVAIAMMTSYEIVTVTALQFNRFVTDQPWGYCRLIEKKKKKVVHNNIIRSVPSHIMY